MMRILVTDSEDKALVLLSVTQVWVESEDILGFSVLVNENDNLEVNDIFVRCGSYVLDSLLTDGYADLRACQFAWDKDDVPRPMTV